MNVVATAKYNIVYTVINYAVVFAKLLRNGNV